MLAVPRDALRRLIATNAGLSDEVLAAFLARRGSPAVIAGGGNSAGQAALFLVNAGTAVMIVIRGPDLAATMSRYLLDRIEADTRTSCGETPASSASKATMC